MPASLEYCLRIMQDLEKRVTDLELSASRNAPVSPPPPQRLHRQDIPAPTTVIKPEAVYPVLRFADHHQPAGPVEIRAKAALEELPRVCEQIKLLWFYPECENLLDKLIIDERGNRSGFPREVMDELLFLARLSRAVKMKNSLSPSARTTKPEDVWQDQRTGRRA